MLIDTDVLTWNLRGNEEAASLLDANAPFSLPAVSYMELLQGLRDKVDLPFFVARSGSGMPISFRST